MGKYLKMAGVFDLPVKQRHVHDENGYGFKLMLFHSVEAECAAHAINSHDELVAEVERLREALQDLMDWTLKNSTAYDCQPYNAALRLLNK